jgi:tetratricopeptide (TPR) repeat protein
MARHQARLIATLAIALSGITASATAQRVGNPQAPKLLVGTLRSTDQKLGPDAAEAIRDRVGGDVSPRNLTVIPKADVMTVLQSSGYPTTEALSSADMNALAKQTRADEYIEGSVTKTATGFQIEASLVLARDMYLVQPLGKFDHAKLEGAAGLVSKAFQEAHKAFDPEKRCRLLAREGKSADATKESASGLQQFPKSVWLRVCQMEIARDTKRPPADIIKIAEEINAIDATNRAALTELVKQYEATGNKDKKIEALLKLYQADPGNPRVLSDVVNELALSGKFALARPIVETAVAANPADAGLVKTYWLILGALDDRKKMNAVGEEMVKIDTSLADSAYFDRTIRAYAADSNFQKATETTAHATAKFPKNVSFWVLRQGLERRNGQTQQAIASIRRIMELDPKALTAPHGTIAQAYTDMNQPDSALAELRAGYSAGEDKTVAAAGVLRIANARQTALGADAARNQDVGEWRKLYALMAFADSVAASQANAQVKVQAKFLMGVAQFQVGYLLLKDNAANTHSCDVAKEAQKYLLEAVKNIPAGGSFAAQAAGQYMGYLNEMLPNADRAAQIFCRPRPDSTKTKKPPAL